uniref:Non-haem dioxygenase N-terminal domain-containing protein n=1 Tax=Arcella intermedia TaxID=1963864 RepID=A0A6B2L8N5_9EUKA
MKDQLSSLGEQIEKAFGFDGLGLVVIKGVPEFPRLRERLLKLAAKFADLPEATKNKYVHEQSHYSFGWSHGKELLKPGVADTFKGSYYNNPQYDVPTDDPIKIQQSPEVCCPNIWPSEEDCPDFENAFKDLGRLIVEVGTLLSHHCDKYVSSKLGEAYPKENHLEGVIRESKSTKARLLHYFEVPDGVTVNTEDSDTWCGWHNDHGSLTGLCSAMFRDIRTGEFVDCPDPIAGLYCRPRYGGLQKISIPKDCLAFQIGECAQIHTGGVLRATPHAVKAINPPDSAYYSRETFAVFMQPNFDQLLSPPSGVSVDQVAVGQYKEGMDFGKFGKATIDYYYGM